VSVIFDIPDRAVPPVLGSGADGFGGLGGTPTPETVFIPSRRAKKGDQEVVLELRVAEGGEVALLAYASLGELVAHCGAEQAWVAVPFERLEYAMRASGAHKVVWNVTLSSAQRHDLHTPAEQEHQ
jgi:hypothetical protein